MHPPTRRGLVPLFAAMLALSAAPAAAQPPPGATVDSLLSNARQATPEFAFMQREAEAAAARVAPAGNLPDPSFSMELRDITRDGTISPTLSPSNVGSTKYTVRQMFPWPGKRDLARAARGSGPDIGWCAHDQETPQYGPRP